MSTRIFLSDFHLQMVSDGEPVPGGGKPYHWLHESSKATAARLLEQCEREAIDELILLGDLFDTWMVPHDVTPASYEEIADAPKNRELVAALRAFGDRALYVPGNHDMHLDANTLERIFPEMRFAGAGTTCPSFHSGPLHAEHGNAHCLFNVPDPRRPHQLPIGYFISRLATTSLRRNGKKIRSLLTLADDLLELVGPTSLGEALVEATMEEANLSPTSRIAMPSTLMGGDHIAIADLKQMYDGLYDEYCERQGPIRALKAIGADLGMLDDAADRLCETGELSAVIFGHTHEPALDVDSLFVNRRVYVNCGAVCNEVVTYARSITHDASALRIELCRAHPDGSTRILKSTVV